MSCSGELHPGKIEKRSKTKLWNLTILVGRVSTSTPGKGPIVVAAYTMNHGKREMAPHYTILHDSGEFELGVAKGDYYVFA